MLDMNLDGTSKYIVTSNLTVEGFEEAALRFSALTIHPNVLPTEFSFSTITGGSTNKSVHVTAPSPTPPFLIRHLNQSQNFTIDRENELETTITMSELGIGPKLYSWSTRRMSIEYLDGKHIYGSEILLPENLHPLMELLRTFHGSDANLKVVDRVESIQSFIDTAKENGIRVPDEILDGLTLIREIQQAIPPLERLSPCHGDFDPSNFLFTSDGPRAIDFEYSALGDPFYDLAKLSVIENFTLEQCKELLLAYDSNAGEEELFRLHYNRLVAAAWGATWHILRQGLSTELSEIAHLDNRTQIRVQQFFQVFDEVAALVEAS